MREIDAEELAKEDYLEYSTHTIEERAISSVLDNCKPVQRRILYAMYDLKLFNHANARKSAYIVGAVMGRFHPHGDQSIYQTLVNMARDYTKNYKYVLGQGGFGTQVDNDSAAPRYTEAKLSEYSDKYMLADLGSHATEYKPNYDEEELEPVVLPVILPDILINGNSGIATPYRTYSPPHHAIDVIRALIAYTKDPDKITISELIKIIKAPDFPTGGTVSQIDSVHRFYYTGKGAMTVKGHYEIITGGRYNVIKVDALPYMRSQDTFIEGLRKIKKSSQGDLIVGVEELSADGKIDIRISVLPEHTDEVVSALIKSTCLQYSEVIELRALDAEGKVRLFNLKEVFEHFVNFRSLCIYKKFRHEHDVNSRRIHLLDGVLIISKDMDKAYKIVKTSSGRTDSINKLIKAFGLTDEQAQYIVDLKFYRLSNYDVGEVKAEKSKLVDRNKYIDKITVNSRNKYLDEIMIDEWTKIMHDGFFRKYRLTTIE